MNKAQQFLSMNEELTAPTVRNKNGYTKTFYSALKKQVVKDLDMLLASAKKDKAKDEHWFLQQHTDYLAQYLGQVAWKLEDSVEGKNRTSKQQAEMDRLAAKYKDK